MSLHDANVCLLSVSHIGVVSSDSRRVDWSAVHHGCLEWQENSGQRRLLDRFAPSGGASRNLVRHSPGLLSRGCHNARETVVFVP